MSTARFNTLQNAAGSKSVPVDTVVDGSAKAWVNFNGTGTVAIRASFNVSSITDNGTGDYTMNFTTAMPDTNYSFLGSAGLGDNSSLGCVSPNSSAFLVSSVRFHTIFSNSAGLFDYASVNVAIFR